jgi:hypothetical protein
MVYGSTCMFDTSLQVCLAVVQFAHLSCSPPFEMNLAAKHRTAQHSV